MDVGAAPHPPAGTFSPYSYGEKGLAGTLATSEIFREGTFPPVTIRGEMPGRAMSGSANLKQLP
ncbi:MAG: hypothetical protein E5W70_17165 [Mesorhizobium sp.]|nr:MAG: hypothetical protein E5W70_17165 [Mesorhizobium sp.]